MRFLEARSGLRPVLLILVLGLGLDLSGTWLMPLIDRDEPRFAEASREMLERKDWVLPTFDGAPRYDKPPLIYWAQMVSYECLGETAFAARLPSAVFATGTALLIFFWGRRQATPRTALMAALVFITCLQMAVQARAAVADMPMIFFTCAALWSGWELTRPEAGCAWGWWWFFNVSLALGFLAKGPVAWLPLAGLGLGRLIHPGHFAVNWRRFALGMMLVLGIVALWGVPALVRTHGEFLYVGLGHHVVYRSFGVLEGHGVAGWLGWIGESPFFFLTFFLSFLPWAIWMPRALRNWWPARRTDIFGWYLLVQAALVFAVFTVVRTKLPHYTLPAFPCLALWLARCEQMGWVRQLHVPRYAAMMAVLIVGVTLALSILLSPFSIAHQLFEKSRPDLNPGMAMAAVQYTEPSLVWEFRGVITNQLDTLDSGDAAAFLRQTNAFILVLPTSLYQTNAASWPTNLIVEQVRGLNFTKGTMTGVTALIHP